MPQLARGPQHADRLVVRGAEDRRRPVRARRAAPGRPGRRRSGCTGPGRAGPPSGRPASCIARRQPSTWSATGSPTAGVVSMPPRQATYACPCSSRWRVASCAPPMSSGDDRDVVDRLGPLVQQHDPGVPRLDLGRGVLAGALADQDQPGDPHAEEGPQIVDLALVEVVGVADQHHLSALGGGLFDRVRHLREERLPGVRHDQAYEVGPPRGHRLGDPVGPVAQLLDRGEHPLARGRGDRPGSVVDDVADDGGRRTRQSRHIVPRHLGHARQSTRDDLPLGRAYGGFGRSTAVCRPVRRHASAALVRPRRPAAACRPRPSALASSAAALAPSPA